jgi:hypothetical protein
MSGTNESNDEEFDVDYFEDEEVEEIIEEEPEEVSVTARIPPARIASFIQDPWPKTVFLVTIIGFIIVIFTPHDIWSIWNWTLVATYGLITVNVIVSPYSLKIWYEGQGWIRYLGIASFFIMNGTVLIGTIDSLLWVSTGLGLIPGYELGSLLSLCFIIIIFLAYGLYFGYRFLTSESQE